MSSHWNQMLRRGTLSLAILNVLLFSASHTTQAEMVTFKFAGVIDSVPTPGPLHPLATPIVKNTPFSGSYSFSSTAPDQDPIGGIGRYEVSHLSLDLLGKHYPSLLPTDGITPGPLISIDATAIDAYGYTMESPIQMDAPMGGRVQISLLQELSSPGVGNESNLLTPPSLGGLISNVFRFTVFDERNPFFKDTYSGHLTSLTLAPVPLPGALLLFGSSLLGLAGFGFCRRRSQP